MTQKKPKICLVEPCHSHEEVLFPLIELLRDVYDVHVIAPQSLFYVDILSRTKHLYTAIPIRWDQKSSRWRRLLRMPGKYRDIRRHVDVIKPLCVVFNSTYAYLDLILIAIFFRRIPKVQIIHEFQHFLKPGMRWIYDQFNLNMVISEQVCNYIKKQHPEFANLNYVLPIFFKSFLNNIDGHRQDSRECASCLKLGVFGSIVNKRRNYRGLLDALLEIGPEIPWLRFQVYLVGEAPQWLQDEIKQHRLEYLVRIYHEFVSFQKMFELVEEMDLVLFLIDDTVRSVRHYNRYKISGTSTLIKAFNKVAVSSTDFPVDDSLRGRCFFYDRTGVKSFLERINKGDLTKTDIQNKLSASKDESRFSFEQEQARLVSMIRGVVAKS
ncbi:MAG TPA: hypothetical protein P5186_21915 [Candidatus Paceibacterota bacterium]|nr:hypothetical protein [Candidatus Paceibacterota bacterium]